MSATISSVARDTKLQGKPLQTVVVYENYPLDVNYLRNVARNAGLNLKDVTSTAHESASLVFTFEDLDGITMRFDALSEAYSRDFLAAIHTLFEQAVIAMSNGLDRGSSTIREELARARSSERRKQAASMLESLMQSTKN
jgi:hypothetical protein